MTKSLLFYFTEFHKSSCLSITSGPADGGKLYACVGEEVTFAWHYGLDQGEVIHDVEWMYVGHSSELLAVYQHGTFVPTNGYSHR